MEEQVWDCPPLLVHVPDKGLLAGVVALVLVDEVHQEEQVVGQVVLLLDVGVEAMGHPVQVVLTDGTDEAVACQLVLHSLQLVSQSTEGVDDETLDDGEQNQGDEQEEGEVEEDPDIFVVRPIRRLNHISDSSAGPDSLVHVEDEAGEDIMAHLVWVLSFLALSHVELSEEVEGKYSVDVADNGEEADSEHKLLAVVGDGLEDDPEGGHADGHVNEVGGEEEVVEVAEQ